MIQPRLHPERLVERKLVPAMTDEEAKRLEGHHPAESWYDTVFRADSPSMRAYKPDGSLLYVVLRGALSAGAVQSAHNGLRGFDIIPDNRGVAVGRDGQGRTLRTNMAAVRDGKQYRSRTTKVPPHVLKNLRIGTPGVVGYMDRSPRHPFCRGCSGNGRNSERLRAVAPLAREVEQLFSYAVPDRWAQQRAIADRTRPEWLVVGTCFTTISVNKNFISATHQDAGDYKPGFTNLVMIRSGQFAGGYLVLPTWRAALELNTGDALFFDPHEWHGTSPVQGLYNRYERLTLVLYYRTKMADCGTMAEELTHARRTTQASDLRSKGAPRA